MVEQSGGRFPVRAFPGQAFSRQGFLGQAGAASRLTRALCGAVLAVAALVAPQSSSAARLSPDGLELLPADARLTLHDVVQQALQRSPRRQVVDARGAEARALREQAGSLLAGAPAVGLRYQTDEPGSGQGLREWETGLALPLWWPGQKQARRAVAEQSAQAAASSGQALLLEVAGEVREVLGELALQQNRAELAHHEWRTAQALEEDVRKRQEAGELPRTDLLLAQDETLSREVLYRSALAALEASAQRYRALTGLDRVPSALDEPLVDVHEVTDAHPRLAAVAAAVQRAGAEVQVVRRDRLGSPELTLGTRHEKATGGEGYSNTLGVSVRVPLGSRAHAAPRQAQAALALAEAQAQQDALRRELELGLRQAQAGLRATRAAVALAEKQDRLAQENLRLSRRAFALGEADLVDLLRVQALAFAATRNLRQQRLQLRLDTARYNQAAGVIP